MAWVKTVLANCKAALGEGVAISPLDSFLTQGQPRKEFTQKMVTGQWPHTNFIYRKQFSKFLAQ